MADQIESLRAAINRALDEAEGTDDGARLQAALASAKEAADKFFGDRDDTKVTDLKEAAQVTRRIMAERRKAAGSK